MLDLTIVLVNYNTKELTIQCLESIYNKVPKTIQYEIVLVDNASSDGTADAIRETYSDIIVVENEMNLGFGRANNWGIKHSHLSKYLLFLNTDTIVVEDMFTPILSYMDCHSEISVMGPFIIYPTGEPQASYGTFPSIASFLFSFFKLNFVFRNFWNNRMSYYVSIRPDNITEVDHIVGVSMFIRRSTFLEVGGFDKDFFLYFEETDLCRRIKERGGHIFINPFVKVIHLLNKSMPSNLFKLTQMEKSRMLYFKKHSSHFYCYMIVCLISFMKHLIWGLSNKNLLTSMSNFIDSYKYVLKK